MKTLEPKFRRRGIDYKLLKREKDVALLQQTKVGWSTPFFEVVIVQKHDGYSIAGNTVEPAEHMPKDEAWGVAGWTFISMEEALRKFNRLLKRHSLHTTKR